MTPCHAFPYPGLSQIGYASTQHPRAARWRFRVAPPQKNILGQNYGYSLSSSRTSFRSQNSLSGFKSQLHRTLLSLVAILFRNLKLSFFLPLGLSSFASFVSPIPQFPNSTLFPLAPPFSRQLTPSSRFGR